MIRLSATGAASSFAMKSNEEKARASGCDSYVAKPYSPLRDCDTEVCQ